MSIQDTATKQYVSEAEVFADAFNYLIYDGEQVIKPEQLTDMDTTQYVIPYHEDEKGKPEAAQKYRDTLKTLAVKTDDRYTYLVLGIENQSHVHYAMPVRKKMMHGEKASLSCVFQIIASSSWVMTALKCLCVG